MANGVPTVGTLDRPENVHDLLKQDRGEDCLSCRVTGTFHPPLFFSRSLLLTYLSFSFFFLLGFFFRHIRCLFIFKSLPLFPVHSSFTNMATGGTAFLGLAAYSYVSGNSQLRQQEAKILSSGSRFGMRSRRFGIAATSVGLAWLGIYRMFL